MLIKRGTLIVSRAEKLFPLFKKRLEQSGFNNFTFTSTDKDGLNMIIRERKPKLILIDSIFYDCCTPYMVADLHKKFPKIDIAVISISYFSSRRAADFIYNGAKSYVNLFEGEEEFTKGLTAVKDGKQYISPEVQQWIIRSHEIKLSATNISPAETEVLKLIGNGYTSREIGFTLQISERTVEKHRENIYRKLSLNNENEAVRAALSLDIIYKDELIFFGGRYEGKALPEKRKNSRRKYDNQNQKR